MTAATASIWQQTRFFLGLCKLKVVALIVFTAIVGMALAVPGMIPLDALVWGTLGIGIAAASAAAINHLLDERADRIMARTRNRPLPTNQLNRRQALIFALALAAVSMLILTLLVNPLTAILTFASLIGYAVIYTAWLKRATPQNIVIGGAAGAAPPVLGWVAVTGEIHAHALILFLIIFVWTPPHFWALAIHRREDYAAADVPMLPVTHGVTFTRWQILFYTIILMLVTLLPWLTGMSGLAYLVGAVILDIGFLGYAIGIMRSKNEQLPMNMFNYSVVYLMALFAFLLIDHYLFKTAAQGLLLK
ncbi:MULTISPECIES: heme o synthase [unclassified Wenzhouxiangella]|uniref:heme o synthase n=1 Tax=unclassified Wenzhouxiangella TaxID=2613841 RepID=UPI000E3256B6|nr:MULTISPECIES: heme o synthase [unclassified Wenzhouxiangella]RFF28656.1 protoheme IX farnesyltransferase [Wenzhouxiangella sp. 15181]RFP70287.1 protoheme IX farnesyltransferase [Wenzhouxiangella sp. 15190]